MSLKLGDTFPELTLDTTHGEIKLYDYLGSSWGMLFSHPANYTPVCTTELSKLIALKDEFKKRDVKLLALSCDSVESHKGWCADLKDYAKQPEVPYPIIADPDRKLANRFGMLDPNELDSEKMPLTCRAVFIIGPDKKLKLSTLYPATTGRNFKEILRVIDSLQLTAKYKVATPADWKNGEQCMIIPSLSNDEATAKFPKGFEIKQLPSKKQYMRFTPDPRP